MLDGADTKKGHILSGSINIYRVNLFKYLYFQPWEQNTSVLLKTEFTSFKKNKSNDFRCPNSPIRDFVLSQSQFKNIFQTQW